MKRPIIGFDRRLRREWLDAIASKCIAGASLHELRKFGHTLLREACAGDEARGKTLTVLFHLWVGTPGKATSLREVAMDLFADLDSPRRIALHWGLSIATYPFFRNAADAAGRLLALQDSVSLAQVQRRLAERWGQRPTAERAGRRIVRSWIDWGLLRETKQRGTYVRSKPIEVGGALASWMVEALLSGSEAESQAITQVRKAPALFPFDLRFSAHDLRRASRLVVHRQGGDEDVVMLKRSARPESADAG